MGKDGLAGGQAKGQIGRHALGEVFGLMVDDPVDVAKAYFQQGGKQGLRHGQ